VAILDEAIVGANDIGKVGALVTTSVAWVGESVGMLDDPIKELVVVGRGEAKSVGIVERRIGGELGAKAELSFDGE
jgi:hypothetical protein